MRKLASDLRNGTVTLQMETKEDLWHLKGLIDLGDSIQGRTLRKVGGAGEGERSKEATRRPVFLRIDVEKVELDSQLRAGGKIRDAPEDVPSGTYHTFAIEEDSSITLIKPKWLKFHLAKLDLALSAKPSGVLLCVFDRDEATFATLTSAGYSVLSSIKGDVVRKGDTAPSSSSFYDEIIEQLIEYTKRHTITTIVLASPSFWKDELSKHLPDDLRKKSLFATCSSSGEQGIIEVLKRPELSSALHNARAAQEAQLVDLVLQRIAQNAPVSYGEKEVKKALEMGAVETLLLTESLLKTKRENGSYPALERMMTHTEEMRGEVFLISSEHTSGKQLDGLGGIAALLRFKLSY